MASRNLPTERTERGLNPFASFRNEMNDFFDRFAREIFPSDQSSFMPKLEVRDAGSKYELSAELPGMKEDDINISLKDNMLVIEGEKKNENKKEGKGFYRSEISYGSFYRAIPLAADVNPDTVSATYKDGVLRISLDKTAEVESKTKRIAINKTGTTDKNLSNRH
ncbi:Hsp20/alpha crystallin family protein [Peredibacter sp. HCB2-198]|uniref:Hsp20/alpha crystallin family protein n=1 Tax=Peredibacter sp. HCB2-198 TaxID=3383025 RepID=UPI0038B663C0